MLNAVKHLGMLAVDDTVMGVEAIPQTLQQDLVAAVLVGMGCGFAQQVLAAAPNPFANRRWRRTGQATPIERGVECGYKVTNGVHHGAV